MQFERNTDDPEKIIIKTSASAKLWEAINSLPEKQRVVLEKHVLGDETYSQIDEELGLNPGRAQQIGINAKRHLRARTVLKLIKEDLKD